MYTALNPKWIIIKEKLRASCTSNEHILFTKSRSTQKHHDPMYKDLNLNKILLSNFIAFACLVDINTSAERKFVTCKENSWVQQLGVTSHQRG